MPKLARENENGLEPIRERGADFQSALREISSHFKLNHSQQPTSNYDKPKDRSPCQQTRLSASSEQTRRRQRARKANRHVHQHDRGVRPPWAEIGRSRQPRPGTDRSQEANHEQPRRGGAKNRACSFNGSRRENAAGPASREAESST